MTTSQAAVEFSVATGILTVCVAWMLGLGEEATVAADKRTPFLFRCLVVSAIMVLLGCGVIAVSAGMNLMRNLGL